MELNYINVDEFNELCKLPAEKKKHDVDEAAIKAITDIFMQGGIFIMEVRLSPTERLHLTAITNAFKDYMRSNHIPADAHIRQGRLFLRNDTVSPKISKEYDTKIYNMSKRNRFVFDLKDY